MLARTLTPAAIVAALILSGCGASEPAAGKCTNSDPKLGVELDVKVVDCDDAKATTKIVKKVKDGAQCEKGQLKYGEQVFCTEPKSES